MRLTRNSVSNADLAAMTGGLLDGRFPMLDQRMGNRGLPPIPVDRRLLPFGVEINWFIVFVYLEKAHFLYLNGVQLSAQG